MSYEEKAVVKIDADGGVVKCAKDLSSSECGYKAGAKVCGKCGAMAVEVKMVPVDPMDEDLEDFDDEEDVDDEEITPEEQKYLKRRRMAMKATMPDMADPEDEEEDALDVPEEEMEAVAPVAKGYGMRKGMHATPGMSGMVDEEDEEMDAVAPVAKGYGMRKGMHTGPGAPEMVDEEEVSEEDMSDAEYGKMMRMRFSKEMDATVNPDDEDDMAEEDGMDIEEELPLDDTEMPMPMPKKKNYMGADPSAVSPDMEAMRMARLRKLGTKSADIGANGYLCAIERKVYPGANSVCDDCPGGCVSEKGMPGLLHVEGLAEQMFKGDVIDSGYSQEADMFVVDVQVKSGHVNEVFVDGTTGEVLGFHRLDDSVFEQKSLVSDMEMIDFNEAADIAVKSIPGTVVAVEPAIFEGFDSYQVEIEGLDGKSYDAFVSLDGEVLGYDQWDNDDTAEIEAEAAEIALKRAFGDDKRQEMAQEGTAMADGSFPVASEEDLRNAIMSHGRAKDVEAAKRHIMKQAASLGKEDMIPAEWVAGEKNLSIEDDLNGADDFLKTLVEFELMSTEVSDNEL